MSFTDALDGLTAKSGELVDGICGVALDPDDPFKRIIEFVGYDLSERSRNAGAQLDFSGHDGNAFRLSEPLAKNRVDWAEAARQSCRHAPAFVPSARPASRKQLPRLRRF
jgi:hypothetical protein